MAELAQTTDTNSFEAPVEGSVLPGAEERP